MKTSSSIRFMYLLMVLILLVLSSGSALAAGVTIVTHGFQKDPDLPPWLPVMRDAIGDRVPSISTISEIALQVSPSDGGLQVQESGDPSQGDELLVLLNWAPVARFKKESDDESSGKNDKEETGTVADAFANHLLTNPEYLRYPIHLIGHSRGGSLVSAIARRLGSRGIWIDQMTTLDPHPILSDEDVLVHENILFADNYFREGGILTNGEHVNGAYNRNLGDLDGEGAYSSHHSNVHLWYFGTINYLQTPVVYEGGTFISNQIRDSWYPGSSRGKNTGHYFSRLRSNDRLCTGDCRPSDGLHPDISLGNGGVREPHEYSSGGLWPNVSCYHISQSQGTVGQTFTLPVYHQDRDVKKEYYLAFYRDDDLNPFNTPVPVQIGPVFKGLGENAIERFKYEWKPTSGDVGSYYIQAKVWDGTHTRYDYFQKKITILDNPQIPTPTRTKTPLGAIPTWTRTPTRTFTTVPVGPISTPTPTTPNTHIVQAYFLDAGGDYAFTEEVVVAVTGVPGSPFTVGHSQSGLIDVSVPNGWSGTITPSAPGYRFTPTSRTYSSVTSDIFEQGFRAFVVPGAVAVSILPHGAVEAGAKWRVVRGSNDESGWLPSGYTKTLSPMVYTIEFADLNGWTKPANIPIEIQFNQSALSLTGTYTQLTGSVSVYLSPPGAVSAGAKWSLDNEPWQSSGASVVGIPIGPHSLRFSNAPGWLTPEERLVTVSTNQTSLVYQNYEEESPDPTIKSITPPSGPIVGGSQLTILGRNLDPPISAVTFGGTPAQSVTWVRQNEIQVRTPAREQTGPVDVVIKTANGQANRMGGFTYTSQRGNNLEVIGQLGGSVSAVAVYGHYAVIGEGPNLVVVDVTSPSSLQPSGRVLLDGLIYDIALSTDNSYAYVSAGDAGIYIVQISDPLHPSVVGLYDTPKEAKWSDTLGGNLYLADSDDLMVFNMSNPAAPVILGTTTGVGEIYDLDVAVINSSLLAFLAVDGDIQVFNVSDPAAPQRVLSHDVRPEASRAVAVSGNRLHVGYYYGSRGYEVFEIKEPLRLSSMGSYPTGGGGNSISLQNGLAYVMGLAGLSILNLDFETGISRLGHVGNLTTSSMAVVAGSTAFVADKNKGLVCIDVSDPGSPSEVDRYEPSISYAKEVVIRQNYAFVTSIGSQGHQIASIDISNLQLPVKRGGYTIGGNGGVKGMDIDGSNLYLATNIGAEIVSLNNPQDPSPIGMFPLSGKTVWAIQARGGMAYIYREPRDNAPSSNMLEVFNISDPSAPLILGSLGFGGNYIALNFCLHNDLAVFPDMNSPSLRLVSIANPADLHLVGSVEMPTERSNSVDAVGTRVFVAGEGQGLLVYDISNPSNPTLLSSFDTDGKVRAVTVRNGFAFISDGFTGVKVVDVQDPVHPSLWGYYNTPGFPWDEQSVTVNENTIFVADGEGGLSILGVMDVKPPSVFITNPVFVGSGTTGARTVTSPTINLGGGSTDNRGVTRVTWLNDRGDEGEASGKEDWTANGIGLSVGQNSLRVFAEDAAGNIGSVTLVVTLLGPTPTPTVTCVPVGPVTAVAKIFPNPAVAGQTVTLDATESSGPITLHYRWSQSSGEPMVALNSDLTHSCSFDAPTVEEETILGFTLLVTSDSSCASVSSATDEVSVTILPFATPTPTWTETPIPTETETVTDTATPTESATPTPTGSDTPTPTKTPTETVSPTPTVTVSPTPSETDTGTATPTSTGTPTDTVTETPTETEAQPTPTPTMDYDFNPDGQIDVRDLLMVMEKIDDGKLSVGSLIDFARFWGVGSESGKTTQY